MFSFSLFVTLFLIVLLLLLSLWSLCCAENMDTLKYLSDFSKGDYLGYYFRGTPGFINLSRLLIPQSGHYSFAHTIHQLSGSFRVISSLYYAQNGMYLLHPHFLTCILLLHSVPATILCWLPCCSLNHGAHGFKVCA